MRLPDFICVGAQKSGTTTLHVLLNKHPKIFLPTQKELHYFDINYNKGDQWYGNHFSLAKKDQICGEITPFYLFHKQTPSRIKLLAPDIKLIFLLRDPIARTISHFYHAKKRGYEPLNIEQALNAEEERLASKDITILQRNSYIARSCYINQLSRYERQFKAQQLLILKSEDLFETPRRAWEKIMAFLEIEAIRLPENIPMANKGDSYEGKVSILVRQRLRTTLATTYNEMKIRYGINWEE